MVVPLLLFEDRITQLGAAGFQAILFTTSVAVALLLFFAINRKRRFEPLPNRSAENVRKTRSLLWRVGVIIVVFQVMVNPFMAKFIGSIFHGSNRVVHADFSLTTIISMALIGPLSEEVLFRRIVLRGFLSRYIPRKAILYNALLFGLFHLMPGQIPGAIFLGIMLALSFYLGRLVYSVAFHCLANAIGLCMMYLAWIWQDAAWFWSPGFRIATIVVGLAMLYWLIKKWWPTLWQDAALDKAAVPSSL